MSKAYEERSRWRTVNLEEPPAALKITQHLARCDLLMYYADLIMWLLKYISLLYL